MGELFDLLMPIRSNMYLNQSFYVINEGTKGYKYIDANLFETFYFRTSTILENTSVIGNLKKKLN